MAGQNTYHDNDHVAVLAAVSSADGSTIVLPWANPVTHALLTSSTATSTTVYTETPTGLINGSNKVYTTVHSIVSIFSFAINGTYLHPTVDYTFSGTTITFVTALPVELSGTPFTIVYQ